MKSMPDLSPLQSLHLCTFIIVDACQHNEECLYSSWKQNLKMDHIALRYFVWEDCNYCGRYHPLCAYFLMLIKHAQWSAQWSLWLCYICYKKSFFNIMVFWPLYKQFGQYSQNKNSPEVSSTLSSTTWSFWWTHSLLHLK